MGGEGRESDRLFVLLLNGRSPFDNGRRFSHKTYIHGVVVANVVLFDHAMMSCEWPLLCLRKMGQSDCKEIATLVCVFLFSCRKVSQAPKSGDGPGWVRVMLLLLHYTCASKKRSSKRERRKTQRSMVLT
jgi:hypothetical protein